MSEIICMYANECKKIRKFFNLEAACCLIMCSLYAAATCKILHTQTHDLACQGNLFIWHRYRLVMIELNHSSFQHTCSMVYVPMLMTIQLFVIYNISNRSSYAYAMSFVFSSKDMFLILLVLSVRIHVQ